MDANYFILSSVWLSLVFSAYPLIDNQWHRQSKLENARPFFNILETSKTEVSLYVTESLS